LSLREDNADLRLTPVGRELGLVDDRRWTAFKKKRQSIDEETKRLKSLFVSPSGRDGNEIKNVIGKVLDHEYSAIQLLRRPEVTYERLMILADVGPGVGDEVVAEQVEIQAKYQGYIDRQKEEVARMVGLEGIKIPTNISYMDVPGLSTEAKQKLEQGRPETLGQASRISGITPAAVGILMVHVKRFNQGATNRDETTRAII
jgi:tRNA uridine 5-carboxymethylaminomethyl modification enzyme